MNRINNSHEFFKNDHLSKTILILFRIGLDAIDFNIHCKEDPQKREEIMKEFESNLNRLTTESAAARVLENESKKMVEFYMIQLYNRWRRYEENEDHFSDSDRMKICMRVLEKWAYDECWKIPKEKMEMVERNDE